MYPSIPQDTKDKVIDYYLHSNITYVKIAKKLNISKSSVYRIIRDYINKKTN